MPRAPQARSASRRGSARSRFSARSHTRLYSSAWAKRRGLEPGPTVAVSVTRVDEAWVEVPLGDAWVAAYFLVLQQGRPVIAEVRIFPAEPQRPGAGQWSGHFLGVDASVPAGGVRSRLLRLPLRTHQVWTDRFLASLRKRQGPDRFRDQRWLGDHEFVPTPRTRRSTRRARGRPSLPNRAYAVVARAYDAAIQRKSRSPVKDVAAALNESSLGRVRSLIFKARAKGYLTQTIQGRSEGRLTALGKRVLRAGVPRTRRTIRRGRKKR